MILTDGTKFTGREVVYAFSNSGMFQPTVIEPINVKVTNNSEDVLSCDNVGTLWLVGEQNSKALILYTVAPQTSYVCVATTNEQKFNSWRQKR